MENLITTYESEYRRNKKKKTKIIRLKFSCEEDERVMWWFVLENTNFTALKQDLLF